MYVRIVERRNADGSSARYVQLAVTERRGPGKRPVAKVVHNLGREDRLDRESIRRLVRSLSRFLPDRRVPPDQGIVTPVGLTDSERAELSALASKRISEIEYGPEAKARSSDDPELAELHSVLKKLRGF